MIILDNLARVAKTNRSKIIDDMLKAKGFNELGLMATEQHASNIQKWRPRDRPDDLGACNPYLEGGRCKHSTCEALYRRWRV